MNRSAFQAPEIAPPAGATQPTPPAVPAPGSTQPGDDPSLKPDLDQRPGMDIDLVNPPDPTLRMTPEAYREAGRASAGLAALLAPSSEPITDYEAAALPPGSTVYKITPEQALKLALVNSRNYQSRIEQVYVRALDVTLARFNFEPQFYAGLTPTTGTRGGIASPNPVNSFTYRTQEATGGQTSILNFGTAAGVGKALSFGGTIVAGFANQLTFNLVGANPVQPNVQSFLPVQIVQPLLRGGGRAVTLEPLTSAERNLLYEVRSFARFRQEFMVSVLTSSGGGGGGAAIGGGPGLTTIAGGADPTVGFLNVLFLYQQVENNRKILTAYESLLAAYEQMAEGAGGNISQLNVDQIAQNLERVRLSLIVSSTQLRTQLDSFKIQLGLPPDLPLVLDRELISSFNQAFEKINDWFADEERDPSDLERFVDELPALEDVVVDGRKVIALGKEHQTQEEVLLAAQRIALENRFELMNGRAQLYDFWRQLAVRANALKAIFNVNVTNQVLTPPTTSNPFGFDSQAKNFALQFNTELPLIRLNERNALRLAEIQYRQQQRALMALEDSVKLAVRSDIRNLIQQGEQYETQRRLLVISLQQRDNSARTIFAPPAAGGGAGGDPTAQTQQLTQGLDQTLNSQNELVRLWVQYESTRLALYRDLGIIPYEEWEAFYELFPLDPRPAGGAGAGARPAAAGAAGAAAGRS